MTITIIGNIVLEHKTAIQLEIPEGTPLFHRTWIIYDQAERVVFYIESLITNNVLNREFTINFQKEKIETGTRKGEIRCLEEEKFGE